MNDQEIEQVLRQAPQPQPPAGLEQTLHKDIPRAFKASPRLASPTHVPFWRQWFPALSFGLLLFGCFVALGVQTIQTLSLKQRREELRVAAAELPRLREENRQLQSRQQEAALAGRVQQEYAELLALKAEVARLTSQLAELPTLQAEAERLRLAIDARSKAVATNDPFAKAKEKAVSTRCVNNMKILGLAARKWAKTHDDVLPPNLEVLSPYMIDLKMPQGLVCPGDINSGAPEDWKQVNSYQIVTRDAVETDPYVVFSRCPLHGHVGLVDGSVHQVGLHSENVRNVDGKVRLVPATPAP